MYVMKRRNTRLSISIRLLPTFGGKISIFSRIDNFSLGVIIWQCVSGEFPFNATEAVGKERRLSIRKQLSEGMLPWGSEKPSDIEWAEVVPIITNCWRRTPTLRPPPAFVAEQILAIYTRFSALPASEQESAPLDKESVEIIINRCSEMVQKARNGETDMEKLTDAEFRVLLQRNQQAFDPVTSFLLGAAIWWQVSKFNDWNDDLSEAYGMHPQSESPWLLTMSC